MKKDRLPSEGDNLNAFLGEGTSFAGKLTFEGTVRIDGKLEGEILTKDTLVIGETATVRAEIHAGVLVLGGTVHGNITAVKKVEIHGGARLYGNIHTPRLSMAEGVIFEGSCSMGKSDGAVKERPGSPSSQPSPSGKKEEILSK